MRVKDRASLVRDVFDAEVAVLYVKSQQKHASDLPITREINDVLRQQFRAFMEQRHWEEWRDDSAKVSDNALLRRREVLHEELNCLGLLEWQKERQAKAGNTSLEKLRASGKGNQQKARERDFEIDR